MVHLGIIRLLGNRAIMGDDALTASAAWNLLEELLGDERMELLAEPSNLDAVMPTLLNYPIPTGKLIADAYLAAFAICEDRRLVTLDRGFRQFRGLTVEILGR
jgi:predicted nucleic acid-binding protein